MEKRRGWVSVIVLVGVVIGLFVVAAAVSGGLGGAGDTESWSDGKGPHIGVVEVSGVIGDSKEWLRQLRAFREDKKIKAIVVRIDSPGGSVAPSQEVFRAIERARKSKKVVVSMATVAASGGYYIASAADRIYALPGTITGSIGVISEFPEVDRLLDLLHVQTTTIKSGALKDVGSPLRPMSDEEKQFLQRFVNTIYEQFLGDVAEARKIDKNELRKIADGRILSGQEAMAAHLVDEMGGLEDAIDGAARLAGFEKEAGQPVPVFARTKRSFMSSLLHEGAQSAIEGARQGIHAAGSSSVEARDPRL